MSGISAQRYVPSARQRMKLSEQFAAATVFDLSKPVSADTRVAALARAVSAMADAPFIIYRPEPRETGWGLAFLGGEGVSAGLVQGFRRILTVDGVVLPYNPLRPDETERNRMMSILPDERRVETTYYSFLRQHELHTCIHNRVLACDGPRLLAWAGAFSGQDDVSKWRARWGMRAAAKRMSAFLRRLVGIASSDRDGLSTTLFEAIPGEAYLVTTSGRIETANALGFLRLSRAYRALTVEIRNAIVGKGLADLDVHAVAGASHATFLVVRRPNAQPRLEPVIEAARARWNLSVAETRVLRLVTQGAANKQIAEDGGLSVRTIEAHVNSIIRKSHSDSRLQVVSRVWLQI